MDNFSACIQRREYFVYMTIKGKEIPSSAIFHGSQKECEQTAKRLNRDACKGTVWLYKECCQ